MTENEVLKDVSKTSTKLLLDYQFYAQFFINLSRTIYKGADNNLVKTAAIVFNKNSNLLTLGVNDHFWAESLVKDFKDTRNAKLGIVQHEILHIVFKHIFEYDQYSDKEISNIAADLVINQCIDREFFKSKEDEYNCIEIDNYPDFFPDVTSDRTGKDNHQSCRYYYRILIEQRKEIQKILGENLSSGSQEGDGDDDSNEEGSSNSDGQGDSNQLKENWDKLNDSQKRLANNITQPKHSTHSTWKDISKLGEGNKGFIDSWIDNTLEKTVRDLDSKGSSWRGKLPASLLVYIDEIIKNIKPSVNWKKQLRMFASNGVKTYIRTTLKRKSKRFNTFPGSKIESKCKILIAIDTSGSVDNESLCEFFAEIRHIWKTGAEIKIVECDVNIGNIWDYKGKFPKMISGRGGTDFNAPIIYANKEYKPDCTIYFTDGYAPSPVKCNSPLMWIVCKNGGIDIESMGDFQGIKVKMNF